MLSRLRILLACVAISTLLTGCEPHVTQREFKLIERWSSRWCADKTYESLDGCNTSEMLLKLLGNPAALQGGDGRPPARINGTAAMQACLVTDPSAIANIHGLLLKGAKVARRGEAMSHYTARTAPTTEERGYHLVDCHYRSVTLEGPPSLISGR